MSKQLERITMARRTLILKMPFWGTLSMRLRPCELPEIGTAGTDGRSLYYAPAFIDELNDPQLRFLIAHEVMHVTNGHIWRRGHRDEEGWNLACDYTIDPIIQECSVDKAGRRFMEPPPGVHINPEWINLSAEDVYARLPKQGGKQGGGGSGGGQSKSNFGKFFAPKEGANDGQEKNSASLEQDWRRATLQAAKAAKAQGHLPAAIERMIREALEPRVDWRAIMRRFMQSAARIDYSWVRPSSRYSSMGLYLPTIQSESMPPIVVVFDTSGSINNRVLAQFDAELRDIVRECRPEATHVAFCDAEVDEDACIELAPDDMITYRPTGGGGTSFKPAFKWVEKMGIEPACLIYLTDCEGDYPREAPDYPVLWCSTQKDPGRYYPPFGEFVYMGGD